MVLVALCCGGGVAANATAQEISLQGTDGSLSVRKDQSSAEQDLERARNFFSYGDYKASSEILTELVLPGRLVVARDLVEAHRMLGISLFLLDQKSEARREFMALLYLDPDSKLDPFLTPPAVVEFFNTIYDGLEDKLQEVRVRKERDQQLRRQERKVLVLERTVRVHPWGETLVPFGYPQFRRGEMGRATIFLGSQALALATMAGSALWAGLLIEPAGSIRLQDVATYRTLRVVNWSAGGLTLALWAAGVAEAILAHRTTSDPEEQWLQVPVGEVNLGSAAQGEE